MDNEKTGLLSKVKWLFGEVKEHWNTPAEGKYVPYKEYKDIWLAVGSNYSGSKTLEYISFAAGCYLIMYHYKLPYVIFTAIALINMPLQKFWDILGWIINDNLGFMPKKTEKKLYTVYFFSMIIGIFLIVFNFEPYLNPANWLVASLNTIRGLSAASAIKILGTHILWNGWAGSRGIFWRKKLIPKFGRYKYFLYSDVVPKCVMVILIGWLPVYNIADEVTRVWVANLLFAIYNLYNFGNCIENCAQNISPNMQERILIRTYPIKLSHILNSIMVIVIPIAIGFTRDEWADINVYRFVIPIIFITFAAVTMIFSRRVKERIPQPPLEEKVQIKFWDGIFGVLRNKYKWTLNVVYLLDSLGNGMLAFTTVLYLYTFRLSGLAYGLIVSLVSFAGTPPDFFTPYFIKRFTYKQIMIFYYLTRAIGWSLVVATILLCGDNVTLCGIICVIILILLEVTHTIPMSVMHDMDIRILDYQMYLSGERLEAFSGVFGWITGPVASVVGLIIPILLLKFGFNSNWDVLYVDMSRVKIIVIPILFDIAGFLLMTIPYLFWDYDAVKQNKVIQVLKRRAEVTEKIAEEAGESTEGS
ncbi:MAG: MFS transporter, partial [Clostridiales bacterium]|nr:MFS transporter [Clostridiales bacterium]